MKLDAEEHLDLAKRHLEKVRVAWDDPTDWSDLAIYGFLCLEHAVMAAAAQFRVRETKKHRDKVQIANLLHKRYGLPNIGKLLTELHHAQKYAAYGDVNPPALNPEDVAIEIGQYIEAVSKIVN
jgi:hypothetical protein